MTAGKASLILIAVIRFARRIFAAMRLSPLVLSLGMAVAVLASALAQQPASQLNSGVPAPAVRTKPIIAPKDAAPKADGTKPDAAAAKCGRFEAGRNAVYAAMIKTGLAELPDKSTAGDMAAFQGELEQTYQKYEILAKAGDVQALRKLLAIEMFVAQIRRKDASDMSVRKACALGKLPVKQQMITDSLSCAVLSLEGERREDGANRERAKTMLATAKSALPETANAATPGKILHDDVVRGLDGCY